MPRVRMKVTKGPYQGGTEWVMSDEDAAAWIERGDAELVPDVAGADPVATSITEDTADEADRRED